MFHGRLLMIGHCGSNLILAIAISVACLCLSLYHTDSYFCLRRLPSSASELLFFMFQFSVALSGPYERDADDLLQPTASDFLSACFLTVHVIFALLHRSKSTHLYIWCCWPCSTESKFIRQSCPFSIHILIPRVQITMVSFALNIMFHGSLNSH